MPDGEQLQPRMLVKYIGLEIVLLCVVVADILDHIITELIIDSESYYIENHRH